MTASKITRQKARFDQRATRRALLLMTLCGALATASIACNDPEYRLPESDMVATDMRADLSDADMSETPQQDARPDLDEGMLDQGEDLPDASADSGPPYEPRFGEPVEVDLAPYLVPVEGAVGGVTVFQSTSQEQLLKGAMAHGSPGDYVMENAHGRYVIEGPKRAMSPCPYGGNVLDAGYKPTPDAEPLEDNLGEICLLANISQTFYPETFTIVQEGSATQAAVLAVTGKLDLLDFLNFGGLVYEFLPATIQLPFDLSSVDTATLTLYYVLRPGDRGVRVVTALRNESQETLHMVMGHLIMGGGEGGYFNPLGTERGFGDEDLDVGSLDGVKFPFMTWRGENSSYTYVPAPDPSILNTDLPAGGVTLYASGASATLLGRDSLLDTLLTTKRKFSTLPGVFHLEPGASDMVTHQVFVGDGSLNTMFDHIYPELGLEMGALRGTVVDTTGAPVAGARVSAISETDRAINQAITDASGEYVMRAPVGSYSVVARAPGAPTTAPETVQITAEGVAQADIEVAQAAILEVSVTTPAGEATPARVTVWCVGECPDAPNSRQEDVTSDALPGGVAAIVPTGIDGTTVIRLPQGDYRVTVSRGMEWSIWPSNAHRSGGEAISLVNGETMTLGAEIAQVVDSSGILSGDFHIHSLTSTDSAVSLQNRVLDYLSEGVDVMVSTDHDYISDYRPAIEALGAEHLITSLIGSEITTSDTGHFNAFPLQQERSHPRGGALDWGNGPADSLLPSEIFDWVNGFPGEQVIQVNHPDGTGTIGALEVDTLRGFSTADPTNKRLPDLGTNPLTGDTRLWAENFTAMELMNDHSTRNFWTIAHWWLTMVGRGFHPTMTAVTDTHKRWANVGGVPRTLVFVGEDYDDPMSFQRDVFARAINDGKAIGTNGPTFRIRLENTQGAQAGLGQTLDVRADGKVTGIIDLEMPEWIEVDSLDIYFNREDVIVPAGEENEEEIAPNMSVDIALDPQTDLEVVATGAVEHKRWKKQVSFTLEDMTRDSYIVVMVRGRKQGSRNMRPVVPENIRPLAFSNPIFLDADGDGYNNPPLKQLASVPPPIAPPSAMGTHTHADGSTHDHTHHDGEAPTTLTRELLWNMVDGARCTHD